VSLHSSSHISFLKALQNHDVKFLLIGGHAAIYYGVNRNTGDLDILIEPTAVNGLKLITTLTSLKLEVPEILPQEFESPLVLSFGFEPDAIDILNYTPGVEFNQVFNNSILVDFDGLKIHMIDIRDLIKNKEALKRKGEKSLLDKYDVEVLKKIILRKK
jgi:predicted nucleotidyltransferase